MTFLLGLIIGAALSPLILALLVKMLLPWMIKRKMNKLVGNVSGKLGQLQKQMEVNEIK